MPELPEVEAFRKTAEKVLHKKIIDCKINDSRIIHYDEKQFLDEVVSCKACEMLRHGKHLLIALMPMNKWISMHFGMTGNLAIAQASDTTFRFERLRFVFNDGQILSFIDQRRFGAVGLTNSLHTYITGHQLGPDALLIDWINFYTSIHSQKTSIKVSLMDQTRIAGIGNIYSDEILFQSKISPHSISAALSEHALHTIFTKMHEVLHSAIDCIVNKIPFPVSFITMYRKKNQQCPRCGQILSSAKLGGRTTYFCHGCQITT